MGFLITADADDRWALRHRMAAPVDSPAYEWWVVAILVAATVATVEVGNMCSCDCLMVKGEGAQKQRTHTPRQENAHIDTLWEREGRGAGTFRGLGYSGAELSGCGARSVSLKVLKSNNTRFVGSAPNIYSWHGTTSTATGPAAPCQSQNSQLVCGKYLKQEVQFRHL